MSGRTAAVSDKWVQRWGAGLIPLSIGLLAWWVLGDITQPLLGPVDIDSNEHLGFFSGEFFAFSRCHMPSTKPISRVIRTGL